MTPELREEVIKLEMIGEEFFPLERIMAFSPEEDDLEIQEIAKEVSEQGFIITYKGSEVKL